jgi:hypothetical protein
MFCTASKKRLTALWLATRNAVRRMILTSR